MNHAGFFVLSLISVGLVSFTALSFDYEAANEQGEKLNSTETAVSSEINRKEDGTRYTVHPDKLVEGCPGMDCIPSIDDPSYTGADPPWIKTGDRVIGLEIGGESRAYPLKIMSRHEIVNDEVGGEPVAVTYCPLCRSGLTYSREVDNDTLELGVSGQLLNANLVMYDRSTESYWNQITGKAIVGPRTGQELELKFSSVTTWGEWKASHPETKILSRNTGIYPSSYYEGNPYSSYSRSDRVGFGVEEVDNRLPAKELVHGIQVGNESKAYPDDLVNSTQIIRDRVGGKQLLIYRRPDSGEVTAYILHRGDQDLNFRIRNGSLTDQEGNNWSIKGSKVGDGKPEWINPQGFYWFAWSSFHPETGLYGLND